MLARARQISSSFGDRSLDFLTIERRSMGCITLARRLILAQDFTAHLD
jgi:hypothetical protein